MDHNIKHLAIIMDGNARWAKANNLTKAEGHKKGAEVAGKIVPSLVELGIPYVSLYAFSSENWLRPPDEVSVLMNLLSYYIEYELKLLQQHQIRLKVIGNLSQLNSSLQKKIITATESTKNNAKMTLYMALGYGSKAEIASACQKIIDASKTDPNLPQISEEIFKKYLYDADMPDVDLFIRPAGLYRMSNFLLWQSAYAELYFTDKLWPDFSIDDIKEAIKDYSARKRNFGGRP